MFPYNAISLCLSGKGHSVIVCLEMDSEDKLLAKGMVISFFLSLLFQNLVSTFSLRGVYIAEY